MAGAWGLLCFFFFFFAARPRPVEDAAGGAVLFLHAALSAWVAGPEGPGLAEARAWQGRARDATRTRRGPDTSPGVPRGWCPAPNAGGEAGRAWDWPAQGFNTLSSEASSSPVGAASSRPGRLRRGN